MVSYPDLSPDVDELVHYRALNGFSVLALVLGLLSFLAIFNAIFWFLPFVALGAGVIGLRRTQRDGSIGRPLAIAGILAAIFFAAVALSGYGVQRWSVLGQARGAAESWMELIRAGRLREAYHWSQRPHLRVQQPELVDAWFDEHPEHIRTMDRYFKKAGLRELASWGNEARLQYRRGSVESLGRNYHVIHLEYLVIGPHDRVPLKVYVERRWLFEEQQMDWVVGLAASADETTKN